MPIPVLKPDKTVVSGFGIPHFGTAKNKPEDLFTKQLKKIKERFNDPEFKKHTIEDVFLGMQDNVNDHMDKNNPSYEKTLEQAKMYDRLHFPFLIPFGIVNSQAVNNIIENHKAKER